MVTGQTKISFKDHANWYFADLNNFRLVAIIGIVLGLILALRRSDTGFAGMVGIFITVLLIMFFITIPLTLGIYGYTYYKMVPQQKDIKWDIDEDRLLVTDKSGNQFSSPWIEITKVIKKPKGWILRRRVGASQWIPIRTFEPDMASKFEALVAETIGW